jgi:hypothetical protein
LNGFFNKRNLLIATAHSKETVLAKVIEALGVCCFVTRDFNTDAFGTFSGEIKREEDALLTARNKCNKAAHEYDFDLVLASEGSFGPHPSLFFTHANEEILVLKDFKNDVEIVSKHLSLETNFNGSFIHQENELIEFALNAGFPTHGLIVRENPNSSQFIFKGLRSWDKLFTAFNLLKEKSSRVYVETDMRAMHNPRRLKVIEQAAVKLVEKCQSFCSSCGYPGFSISEPVFGLLCSQCGFPTRSPKAFILKCEKCSFTQQIPEKNKTSEDPMFCDFCNP